ncbi:helix-turn-helix domain-containing protein [Desulforamulus hydrothermalis]|uniref:Transcriptional regulator, XRE family n=1 Tax=Desulforamulus hydrothermalis Lam5 = DSM 18033 TaxID=1121428 RepID=K8E0A2_9FIRM|nr:helix-turn-helix transcriptional regulator [Desulforamulus hydrothermalis]CCO08855.1 Transcriptional regulator, XRE family [Desulforamulus hydrothermalis Lam5 = DSM 18033]SHG73282.1 Transcriptional regulator, contains XRE-family HTH domain [Desulforamulus hydrothermalis Lam5 = DSM 18033]
MSNFENRLKALRKANKKTQSDMATLLNITLRQYQLYEAGQSSPPLNNLITLADFFNVSLDYLMGRSDDPSPPQVQPLKGTKRIYDVIARVKDLPDEHIEDITDTLDALVELHLKKLKTKQKVEIKGDNHE